MIEYALFGTVFAALLAALWAVYRTKNALVQALKSKEQELERNSRLLIEKTMELYDKNISLEKSKSSHDNFMAIVSHQLRTPLTGLHWTLELLSNDKIGASGEQRKEFLTMSLASTRRMMSLVSDLLYIFKIESGYTGYALVKCNPDDIVREVSEIYIPKMNEKKISYQQDLRFGDGFLFLDLEMIRIVFNNLFDNAVAYTPEGGSVACSTRREENSFYCEVQDTGIGIGEEEDRFLFGRFYRSEEARKLRPEGSGLGLYLSRNIVQEYGGTMGARPGKGSGTVFYFRLPLKK